MNESTSNSLKRSASPLSSLEKDDAIKKSPIEDSITGHLYSPKKLTVFFIQNFLFLACDARISSYGCKGIFITVI